MRSPLQWPAGPDCRRRLAAPVAAGLLAAAAAAHFSTTAEHLREWWLFGAFFLAAGTAQSLGALAFAGGHGRRLAAVTGWASLAVAALWVLTRTSGLPFGPHPWTAETPSWLDTCATAAEVATAALCFGLLAEPAATQPRAGTDPGGWGHEWEAFERRDAPPGPASPPPAFPHALPQEEDHPWASV